MEKTIGRYQLLEKIGSGGMGTVFRGVDPALARPVAIKFLPTTGSQNQERFLREARLAASLSHPNIISVYDIAELGDGIYIVQEFLEGTDLEHILRESEDHRLPAGRAVDVLAQVAGALAFAHSKEIVHRDVKPSNVWLTPDGQVKMIDFGIALSTKDDRLTMTGAWIGTVSYIAPEQLEERPVDFKQAEVFSFGALAFEVISGVRAFSAESLHTIFQKILAHDPPFLGSLVSGVPDDVSELIQSCLQKDPSQRPESMAVVAARLAAIGTSATFQQPLLIRQSRVDRVHRYSQSWQPASAPPPRRSSPDAAEELPRQLGRFTLLEPLSEGKTGLLYKAFDPVRSSLVGVKVVSSESAVDRERLLRAGKIWLDLHHPNVVRVLEVHPGGAEHGPLIVSELIDGRPLNIFASEVPLTVEQRVYIAVQICDALTAIHGRGVIHREVKPESILVIRDGLKAMLLDSGIARSASGVDPRLTKTGVAVGDFGFMAPEQFDGRPEQRSDLFSLAAVLVFLLTKEAPLIGDTQAAIARLRVTRGVSSHLQCAIEKALAVTPDERFESSQAFAEALKESLPLDRVEIPRSSVVVTLHGIRTHAKWQRAFSEVASERELYCRLDKWNFGYFSVLRFLMPWSRLSRVAWFRRTYQEEFPEVTRNRDETELPSIIAHSFGTFILGNALVRYPYLRFNKVILCGSILPTSFPWDALLARGQVQAVRNEYGAQDSWTRMVGLFVPGTGASGIQGFACSADRCEQEQFEFTHSEYFERSHMEGRWLPFLRRRLTFHESREQSVPKYPSRRPWLLYSLYGLIVALVCIIGYAIKWRWF